MADKRMSGGGGSGTNLLFSASSELSFSVPFIPVSLPGTVPNDDATEVGEEDSFLGQASSVNNPLQTFSYFSQTAAFSSSNDPFASIGQAPISTSTRSSSPAVFSKPPSSVQLPARIHNGQSSAPLASNDTAPQVSPPPPLSSQVGYNPYRHNNQSSRANPYLPPPQLQQDYTMGQSSQAVPLVYQSSSVPQPPPPLVPPFIPPPPPIDTRPTVSPPPPFLPNLYEPVKPHWFYCKLVEGREVWCPFSGYDSANLEEVYNSVQPDPESVVVSTAGGRYDVYLYDREMKAIYWEEEDSEVRRCSWFYKGDNDSRFIPYSEEFSEKLEAEYKKAVMCNQWHRRLEFPDGETIVIHNPKVIVQFQHSAVPEEWGTPQDGQSRPRVVKRGLDDSDDIPDGEEPQADHLVFMVHGIGPVCDLRFRSMVECVDDFRTVSLKLLQTHFKKSLGEDKARRVEFLPVCWHSALHGDATGVDRHIKKITLPSIGRLRHFTNETLLDILFYNSPTYCQTIVDKVVLEVNRLHRLFMSRNPDFRGGVSVVGHSLGSLILFDILSNQCDTMAPPHAQHNLPEVNVGITPVVIEENKSNVPGLHESTGAEHELASLQKVLETLGLAEYCSVLEKEKIDGESLLMCTIEDLKDMGIPLGPRKKIAKYVEEQSAIQEVKKNAEAARKAGEVRSEETDVRGCPESTKSQRSAVSSVSSVHVNYEHFGMGTGQVMVRHDSLDFKPVNFFALGSPVGMFLTVRGLNKIDENYKLPTCKGFFNIYHPLDPVAYRLEPMIVPDLDLKPVLIPHHKGRKRLHLELKESLSRMGSDLKHGFISSLRSAWQTLNDFARAHTSSSQLQAELEKVADQIQEEEAKQQVEAERLESTDSWREEEVSVKIGMLNGGRRIDYVLQEKPIESFNEYLFALQSHLCYWESEDTALLILKEIYKSINVIPDQPLH